MSELKPGELKSGDRKPDELTPDEIEAFVDQMAAMVGLPIPPDCRAEVVANVKRTAAIARLVLEFPLPVEGESAPRFEP